MGPSQKVLLINFHRKISIDDAAYNVFCIFKDKSIQNASVPTLLKKRFAQNNTSGDELPELSTADANVIKAWQEEKHQGSTTSILFFTKEQLQLWDERNVLFMEDYSTGNP